MYVIWKALIVIHLVAFIAHIFVLVSFEKDIWTAQKNVNGSLIHHLHTVRSEISSLQEQLDMLRLSLAIPSASGIPVVTTAYCPDPPCVSKKWADGYTATMTKARKGVCAADWEYFPVGTKIYVPDYGLCSIEDSGKAIKGFHIDLFFHDYHQAVQWGRQQKNIQVLRWGQHG